MLKDLVSVIIGDNLDGFIRSACRPSDSVPAGDDYRNNVQPDLHWHAFKKPGLTVTVFPGQAYVLPVRGGSMVVPARDLVHNDAIKWSGSRKLLPDYPSLLLKGNDIDVWLVHYSEIVDERLLARMYDLLNEAERYKHARFYFKEDRKRYLVTRAMVRTVLSYYAMVAPSDWVFGTNAYGRPIIANKCPDAATLSFNISHTLGLIAIAAGRERELGIDIENVAASEISPDLAGHFFSPQEAAALQELPPEQRQQRFFEYWTFKESYIKARGMGLSLPLDGFTFQFPSDKEVRLTVSTELGDDGNRWHFRQYRPTAAHLLALCAERRAGNPTVVTMRGMIPTVGYETLIPVLLKASDSD